MNDTIFPDGAQHKCRCYLVLMMGLLTISLMQVNMATKISETLAKPDKLVEHELAITLNISWDDTFNHLQAAIPTSTNLKLYDEESDLLQIQNVSFFRKLPCLREWANRTTKRLALWHPFTACYPKENGKGIKTTRKRWAYKHVFKGGGTTAFLQCNSTWLGVDRPRSFLETFFAQHEFFTFVRDPVDHFLSGAVECAARRQVPVQPTDASLTWYLATQQRHGCFQHSIPQVEYLLYNDQQQRQHIKGDVALFLDHIGFVGDMSVMERFFRARGLSWDDSLVERRHYDGDSKSHQTIGVSRKTRIGDLTRYTDKKDFIGLRSKVSNETLLQICNYVKMDYCIFDYSPPPTCRPMVESFCQQTCPSTF